MKKKLLSLAIAVTLMSQTFAYAGTLKTFVQDNAAILGTVSTFGSVSSDNVFTVTPDVESNVTSKVKSGSSAYAPSISVSAGSSVDYEASIDMTNVRNKFTELYTYFYGLFGSDAAKTTAFENSTVEGKFTVTIDYTSGISLPSTLPTAASLVLVPAGTVFTVNDVKYPSTGKAEVEVIVNAGTKISDLSGSSLATKLADISVELTGCSASSNGSITASMTGYTDIVESDSAKYGKITYKSTPSYSGSTATVNIITSGGGRTNTSSEPEASYVDGDKENDLPIVKRGSKYYVDIAKLPTETEDGEEIDGWTYDPEGEEPAEPQNGFIEVKDGTTLYPKVKQPTPKAKLRVGDEDIDIDVTKGDDGTFTFDSDTVEAPEREGYVFEGFYKEPAFLNRVEGVCEITEDTVLYPRYVNVTAPDKLISDEHMSYISGYPDGTVKPNNKITREEVAMIFYRLLDPEYRADIEATTNSFPDVEDGRWSNVAISTMANGGFIVGDLNGNFNPSNYITRAEFSVITSKFAEAATSTTNNFTDVEDHWGKDYILNVAGQYWINGYEDGTFRPDGNLTRAEAMTIINKILVRYGDVTSTSAKQWPDVSTNDWFYSQIIEATTDHKYTRAENGWAELWQ